jgi:hypothetical protein
MLNNYQTRSREYFRLDFQSTHMVLEVRHLIAFTWTRRGAYPMLFGKMISTEEASPSPFLGQLTLIKL